MKKKVLYITAVIAFIVLGNWYYWYADNYSRTNNSSENGLSELVQYTDEGLGFSFNYPLVWKLAHYENNSLGQRREEKVELTKGGARILIDPLGRIGVDQFSSSVETESLTINGIQWVHIFWPQGEYHRYIIEEGEVILKDDQSTDGNDSNGQLYNKRRPFRTHVYLEDVVSANDEEEALETVSKILNSLSIL